MDHHKEFLDEKTMENLFVKEPKFGPVQKADLIKEPAPRPLEIAAFYKWYQVGHTNEFTYDHHRPIKPGEKFNCETITDEWIKWFCTTPKQLNPFANPGITPTDKTLYSSSGAFLFDKGDTFVYFVAASPFQKPDFRRVIMLRKAPLLVPVYNVLISPSLFPMLDYKEYEKLIGHDLKGIKPETVKATFDGNPLWGCCVIRDKPLVIQNIPKDNVFGIPEDRLKETNSAIEVYQGGFWLLLKEEVFTPGDHLLYFRAESVNYEIEAKILISTLAT